MKCLVALVALATIANTMSAQATEKDFERARKVLASTPLIDGHNDLAWAIRESKTAPMDVAASVRGIADVIEARRGSLRHGFVDYEGREIPW